MTLDRVSKINGWFVGILKVAYLNFLWIIFTVLGLGIFSIGPATYAMMTYYDHWLRKKEEIPVAKSFWQFFKERYKISLVISWLYLGTISIFLVNIFFNRIWSLQMVNIIMLILVLFSFTHVYTLMSVLNYKKIKDILKGAALLGFGYLHYAIITWTIIGLAYFIASTISPGLLVVFGIGFTGLICSLSSRQIFKDFLPIEE